MLTENTLFGNVDKVAITLDRIRQFEPPEGYYVAFSGGKDSCVILDLIKRSGVKYDVHYNLTTVDPPELVYFIRKHHPDVEWSHPKKSMWQLIVDKKGPPMRHMRYCCSELKERGGKGRIVVTGIRWAESARRSKRHLVEQCNTDNSKQYLHPIIDWSQNDVWDYIRSKNIPYCSLYDEGFTRIGCILCPYASQKIKQLEIKRWPKYADLYRIACQKAYEKAQKGRNPYINFTNGDELFNWWISGKGIEKINPDQTVIFE